MKALYGWFKDAYFQVNDKSNVVIPDNFCFNKSNITTVIHDCLNQADVNTYVYHTDLTTDTNKDRIGFMKDWLIDGGIKEITPTNDDYVIQIEYELYNKDGKPIKTGTTAAVAKFVKALINSSIKEDNSLLYRDAFVFDSSIEISIPVISKYGIYNSSIQHPYTLRIKKISVLTTIGDSGVLIDTNTQTDNLGSHTANYFCHKPTDYSMNNFSSHFVTNACIGTTMINSLISTTELDTEAQYKYITMCDISMDDCNEKDIKIDHKLNTINVNIEVLLDNFMEVYDKADIDAILIENKNPDHEVCPEEGPEDGPVE